MTALSTLKNKIQYTHGTIIFTRLHDTKILQVSADENQDS